MLTGKDKFALAMKKRSDYPLTHRAKRDIGCEGGYSACRIFSTADAVPAIRCLLATSRSEKVSFSAVSANHVFLLRKKRSDYPLSHRAKRDIGCEGGYSAFRIFSTADAVPEKIAHSRLRSRFLRCKNRCYGEPSFCCAKSGSIIRSRPKHKQTSFRMSVYVWWARVDSDHRS